jgi:hypothetical protein
VREEREREGSGPARESERDKGSGRKREKGSGSARERKRESGSGSAREIERESWRVRSADTQRGTKRCRDRQEKRRGVVRGVRGKGGIGQRCRGAVRVGGGWDICRREREDKGTGSKKTVECEQE